MLQHLALLVLTALVYSQESFKSYLDKPLCDSLYIFGGNSQPLGTLPYTTLCYPAANNSQIIFHVEVMNSSIPFTGLVVTAVQKSNNNTPFLYEGAFDAVPEGYSLVNCAGGIQHVTKEDNGADTTFTQVWHVPANTSAFSVDDVRCRFMIARTEIIYWNDVLVDALPGATATPNNPEVTTTDSITTAENSAVEVANTTETASTPDFTTNGSNPVVTTTGSTPDVTTTGSTPDVTTTGSTPDVTTTNSTPDVTATGSTPDVTTTGSTPDVTTTNSTPDVTATGSTPDVTTTNSTPDVTTTGSTPDVTTTGSTPDVTTDGSTPDITTTGSITTAEISAVEVANTTETPSTPDATTIVTDSSTSGAPETTLPGSTSTAAGSTSSTILYPGTRMITSTPDGGSFTATNKPSDSTVGSPPILVEKAVKKSLFGQKTGYWCEYSGTIYMLARDSRCSTFYVGVLADSEPELMPSGRITCPGNTRFSTEDCICTWAYQFTCPPGF